jgi:hypothetical protein
MQITHSISSLDARLRGFFRSALSTETGAGNSGETFESLALDLFRFQFHSNPAYNSLCSYQGVDPEKVTDWRKIPAVPASAFKDSIWSCLPAEERVHFFQSSGTTAQLASRHFHNQRSLSLYKLSLSDWFGNTFGLPGPEKNRPGTSAVPMLFLTPPETAAPHSSLVHMFETLNRTWSRRDSCFFGRVSVEGTWTIDFDAALKSIDRACAGSRPVFLMGTAFLFVHLLDFLSARGLRFRLPPGSRVLETGGYKGQSRALPRPELHSAIGDLLGVEQRQIFCEYGMCELSSQAYDFAADRTGERDVSRIFHFPPWARTQIVSPENGTEVEDGAAGLVRVFDLANAYSVVAIQTEDVAIRRGAGFELIGRAQTAEARGCSLMTA